MARLLGEAGDRIMVDGPVVRINGQASETERGCPDFQVIAPESGVGAKQACQVEAIRGMTHWRGSASAQGVAPKVVDQEVPAGHVFLVSDNRAFPYDSRDFGPVSREACAESVFFRLIGRGGYFDSGTRLTFIQ